MLREMTSNQLIEWIAYYQLEPWGMAALDTIIAHFKALFVNAQLKKGKRPFKPNKFLTFLQRPEPKQEVIDEEEE